MHEKMLPGGIVILCGAMLLSGPVYHHTIWSVTSTYLNKEFIIVASMDTSHPKSKFIQIKWSNTKKLANICC